jgi:hypothetical protein
MTPEELAAIRLRLHQYVSGVRHATAYAAEARADIITLAARVEELEAAHRLALDVADDLLQLPSPHRNPDGVDQYPETVKLTARELGNELRRVLGGES